jgi:dTDP-4-dehydrorhamnose reductase
MAEAMENRVLVIGAQGQVGSALLRAAWPAGCQVVGVARPEADLAQPDSVTAAVARHRPRFIVNAAAYTAVDKAESERAAAFAANAEAPGLLAQLARETGATLVHLSTDYVFDGTKNAPYVETDPTGPLGVYGESKLAGEQAVAAAGGDWAILRTAWVYDAGPRNFVATMLRLGGQRDQLSVVNDQQGCPTSAAEIADAIVAVVASRRANPQGPAGIFHFSGGGATTWFDFANAIFAEAASRGHKVPQVLPIPTEQYPTPARRPRNSRLDCRKFTQAFGVALRPWQESLARTMAERARLAG